MPKTEKSKKKNNLKEIIILAFIFILIFSLTFYSIFKIINKKNTTDYYGIKFVKKSQSGITYYEATFKDTYGEDFTFNFLNNPYDLEDIEINGKIELKNNTIIFTDPIDKCENFYDNAIALPVFLFKTTKTNPEVRSIEGINFSNYYLSNDTFVYVKKIGTLGQTSIDKTDAGYIIYVKNCEIEKSFERFILAAYLNKQNITLPNQKI